MKLEDSNPLSNRSNILLDYWIVDDRILLVNYWLINPIDDRIVD